MTLIFMKNPFPFPYPYPRYRRNLRLNQITNIRPRMARMARIFTNIAFPYPRYPRNQRLNPLSRHAD